MIRDETKTMTNRLTPISDSEVLTQVRLDTLTELAWVVFGFGIAALPRSADLVDSQSLSLLVAGALMIGGLGAIQLRKVNFGIAKYWLIVSLIVALAVESYTFPNGPARFFFPVAIVMSSLLLNRRGVLAVTFIAAAAHVVVTLLLSVPINDTNYMLGPLFVIVLVAVASWLGSRQLRLELDRAQVSHDRARDMLGEVRDHQANLAKTVKALEEANRRIERAHERIEMMNTELIAARNAAEDADRVKTEFLAHMSHELRTPLNAILNFTAFVSDGLMGEVNEMQIETLDKVVESGNHLLSLINDVLDISKIEAGMMNLFVEDVDINAAVRATVSTTRGLIKNKPVELSTEIDEDLPIIKGDKRRIRQIFLNLVSNAVKFTPEGKIGIHAKLEDEWIHIWVDDTGIGISPEDQVNVFQAFKQAQHELQNVVGTGLGLSITKHFVEAHGGKIWVDSELGVGSSFHITLPSDGYLLEETVTP